MLRRSLLAALAALPMVTPPTRAQSCLECSGTVWYVDSSSSDPRPTGTSWAEAFTTLTEALAAASSGDCIWVAAGRYFPSSTNDRNDTFYIDRSLKLYGGFDGSETCLADRAGNFTGTRLSGEIGNPATPTDNSYLVVEIAGFGATVTIDGFQIRDAYNDGGNGGGIRDDLGGVLVLRNCTIRGNRAGDGAGLYTNGRFHIASSKFISNVARGVTEPGTGNGGAIWASTPGDDCNVHNVEFKNNSAGNKGGAFFLRNFSFPPSTDRVIFANGLFHGNTAQDGGVGYVAQDKSKPPLLQPRAQAELVNCTLANNGAGSGAALFAEEPPLFSSDDPGKLDVYNCILWGNVGADAIEATDGIGTTTGESVVGHSIVEPAASFWDCSQGACSIQLPCSRFSCSPLFVGATFRLGTGSPAIDSGDLFSIPFPNDFFDLDGDGNTAEDLPFDLDLRPRVQALGIDLGCYEE